MKDIDIRSATKADIPLLAQISKQTFLEAFADNNTSQESFEKYVKEAFNETKITDEFEETTSLFLLLENKAGQALAYGKLRWDNRRDDLMTTSKYIEVERIYVLKNYWRIGLGKLMMNEMMNIARKRGCEEICLSVYEENIAALHFYERLDFQRIGKVEFKLADVIEYDVLMTKNL